MSLYIAIAFVKCSVVVGVRVKPESLCLRQYRQQAPHAEGLRLCVVPWRTAQQGEDPQPLNNTFCLIWTGPLMSLCCCPLQVAVYVPGSKGAPSFVRLYQYPVLGGATAALANKSFFKADRVTMQWNKKGGRSSEKPRVQGPESPDLDLVLFPLLCFSLSSSGNSEH